MTRRSRVLAGAAALLALAGCGRAAGPVELTAATPAYSVVLTVPAPVVGTSEALVRIVDRSGDPVDDREVEVAPVMADMGHAVPAVAAAPADRPGEYRTTGGELFSMSGPWDVDVHISPAAGGAAETARFRVLVSDR